MKQKPKKELLYEDWMRQAKEYAMKHHKIKLNDDHRFWVTVKTYWNINVDPANAVKDAVKIYGF
jgi:hypothetical protein